MSRGCGGHGNGAADTRACGWCWVGDVLGEGGTGTAPAGRGWHGARRGGRSRLGRALVEPGWLGEMVHARCSTVCRPAVHRQLRAAQGAKMCEVGLGELGSTRGRHWTTWFPGLLLGEK